MFINVLSMSTNAADLVELGGHQLSPCGVHALHHYHLQKENTFITSCLAASHTLDRTSRGTAGEDVRVLGRMLSEPAAQLLGTLCCSWWPCNLMHTS